MPRAGPATIRVVGRYALYQAIASGGMATVFLGRLLGPVGFARTVAIKRLHPQFASDPGFVSMFLDEARLAARIRHPNVVSTLDVVATKGELFLVMDYVHGESLSTLLRGAIQQGQPIPVPIVVAIMSGALQGLDAAHEAKSERGVPLQIVHRDVSPQNILLGNDGHARLLDFGVARATGRLSTTQEGQIKGKLAYMPPEQLRGKDVGPATDVYAAGVVLWEALVGRRLFRADNQAALVSLVLAGNTQAPSQALYEAGDVAGAQRLAPLDGAVMRALALAKEQRWQTARDLARALEAAVVPATTAQVSDWVQAVAADTLRERACIVAEIESSSALDLTSGELGMAIAATAEPSVRDLGRTVTEHTVPAHSAGPAQTWADAAPAPIATPVARTQQSRPFPAAAVAPVAAAAAAPASPPSTSIEPPPASPAPARTLALVVGGALITILVGGGFLIQTFLASRGDVATSSLPSPPPPQASSSAGAADASSAVPAAGTSPPQVGIVPARSAPSAVVPAMASPTDSAISPARGVPSAPLARHSARSSAAPRPATTCDPPYTYGADGMKHFKDECL